MDMPQLKLLAGRVRDLLQDSNTPIGHSQALDLIAALPGVRNWPEVQAFPARVAACELDVVSAGRLAFRLKKKFNLEFSPQEMLAAMVSAEAPILEGVPHVWPAGPAAGVYITTSQTAIDALLRRYEEATDGELVYAERAGSHWEGSIDLGDDGLWSSGLPRVASGTLIVVGPIKLNQQEWDDGCVRLARAAMCAYESGHRVAVLIHTPSPEMVFEDVRLMVESTQPNGACHDKALLGAVTDEGELHARVPFAGRRPPPKLVRSVATTYAIPENALPLFRGAVQHRTSGLILLGSEDNTDVPAIDLAAATLALTEDAGPAARIMPRDRSTPAKDWQVPDSIAQLPFLPSIESAYEQGYRRMVVNPNYTEGELLLEFASEVLLIAGVYGSDVDEIFMRAIRTRGRMDESELIPAMLAVLGVKRTENAAEPNYSAVDLYVPESSRPPESTAKGDRAYDYLKGRRVLRWEEQMGQLLDSGKLTDMEIKKLFGRSRNIDTFLAERAILQT
jgi:hypothetical protein